MTKAISLVNGKLAADSTFTIPAGLSLSEAIAASNNFFAKVARAVIEQQLPHHLTIELFDDPEDMEPRLYVGRVNSKATIDLGSNADAASLSEYLEHCDEDELHAVLGPELASLDRNEQLPELFESLFEAALRLSGPNAHTFYHPQVAALRDEQAATETSPERRAAIAGILGAVGTKAVTVDEATRIAIPAAAA